MSSWASRAPSISSSSSSIPIIKFCKSPPIKMSPSIGGSQLTNDFIASIKENFSICQPSITTAGITIFSTMPSESNISYAIRLILPSSFLPPARLLQISTNSSLNLSASLSVTPCRTAAASYSSCVTGLPPTIVPAPIRTQLNSSVRLDKSVIII